MCTCIEHVAGVLTQSRWEEREREIVDGERGLWSVDGGQIKQNRKQRKDERTRKREKDCVARAK